MHQTNINRALQFIDKNFSRPLSLDEVSRESGISKYHFTRIFKGVTGITFKTYHNKKRIEAAKDLLKNHEMLISDICYLLGFNDVSYFNRVFRKYEGATPSLYKKRVTTQETHTDSDSGS